MMVDHDRHIKKPPQKRMAMKREYSTKVVKREQKIGGKGNVSVYKNLLKPGLRIEEKGKSKKEHPGAGSY